MRLTRWTIILSALLGLGLSGCVRQSVSEQAIGWDYVDAAYLNAAEKGYNGIIKQFIEVAADGQVHIHKACTVAGLGGSPYRDGSYEYYIREKIGSDDPKAVGPFILASLELESMAKK